MQELAQGENYLSMYLSIYLSIHPFIYPSNDCQIISSSIFSFSAGIPDFRSGMDTVLPTGPGVWELQEKGVPHLNPKVTPILRAIPTSTHMAVVKLHEAGKNRTTD